MQLASSGLALGLLATFVAAQAPDGSAPRQRATDARIMLQYGQFDPLVGVPQVPPQLVAGHDVGLFIVQFHATPTDHDRDAVRAAGGAIKGYLPNDCHLVQTVSGAAALIALDAVRWVGPYHPAYRLESFLVGELAAGRPIEKRRYNLVMVDKRRDKAVLEGRLRGIGADIVDRHIGGLLFTADLTGAQLLQAARFDEVLWIDRWMEPGKDMNNARIQGGGNYVETVGGYTGAGIRGHIYEGCEFNHPDFNTALTNVLSGGEPDRHGHCTTGIVFGNGNSDPNARGMAPNAIGFYTNYESVTAGFSRNAVINEVVNNRNCMFTTASWGSGLTGAYTATSADADDVVFDHRIPWTNSMSNWGNNTMVRPEAWAKNVISIGGIWHSDNSNAGDDSWNWPGPGGAPYPNASIGPAADGRNKPDLCASYDRVWTSDLTFGTDNGISTAGTGGYNTAMGTAGNSTTGFNGTSSATPIVAGHNALAIQMYTDSLFSNPPRVVGGTRFQNRPYAQTLKALMICGANLYTPTATNNRREHCGYGFPNLQNLYDRRDLIAIVPEDAPIQQGQTHTYTFEVLPGQTLLKVCMTYLDPMGNPAAAFTRINDLNLRVIQPNGTAYLGNVGLVGAAQSNQSATGGTADSRDTVECVIRNNPMAGNWTVEITAPTITVDGNVATVATDAVYALVVNGGRRVLGSGCARYIPDTSTTSDASNYFPFGGYAAATLQTTFAHDNNGNVGGTVYFDVTVNNAMWLTTLDLNTLTAAGTEVFCDVYRTAIGGSYAGNETNVGAWIPLTAGRGTSAGADLPTTIDLQQPFYLPAGHYGVAIVAGNFNHAYTNGTNTYPSTNLQIDTGSASNGAFGGGVFLPRTANVTLGYRLDGAQGTNIRYQTIVRHNELGNAGMITGLSFSADGISGRHWNESLLVRMANVPAGHSLVSTYATNIPSPTTVLNLANYSFEYVADQWRDIGLQTPFAYNGTGDVVIDVVARGNWQTTSGLFHDDNEPRVYNALWSGATPTTGTVDNDQSLRMRVQFHCAQANEHGSSCGRLIAAHTGDGHRGATFQFRVTNATPNSIAFIGLGQTNAFPLPFALTGLGWTNCIAFSQSDVILTEATNAAGGATNLLTIPNNASLDGAIVYGQWFQIDTSEPGNLTFSNYTRMIVGLTP